MISAKEPFFGGGAFVVDWAGISLDEEGFDVLVVDELVVLDTPFTCDGRGLAGAGFGGCDGSGRVVDGAAGRDDVDAL